MEVGVSIVECLVLVPVKGLNPGEYNTLRPPFKLPEAGFCNPLFSLLFCTRQVFAV
jgi:hypothetical protein